MSGTGRRRHSKWDLKEDTSPENHDDSVRSNKDRGSFTGHVSRDHMSGTRDLQRAEGLNEKSIPGSEGDGHHATGKSTCLDGGRQKSRNHSPRSRGRSFRSRSRSNSRSRSPARNPRQQPGLNDQTNRSGHSTPLCRDFAAGRCRKGDRCHFVHNGSSGRHLDERIGSDRESIFRDDEALKSHSDIRSTGRRSSNICNDFLKGRCRRGASCKFSHHDPGSDEFGKGAVDGTENKPPDETQLKNHLNGIHEVSGDVKWGDKTLPRGMQNAHGQGAHQLNESFSASNPMDGVMQMPYHQAAFDDKPADDQSQMAFPSHHHPEGDDLQKLHHQSVVDSILDDGAYTGIADATSGPTPSEQLSQIPYLSATLAQLIEKREQLPQLYAANPQGTLMEGGSVLPNFSASVLPVSEAACDSIETKMASTSNELVTGETTVSDLLELCLSRDDELGHQSLDPNQQGAVDNENGGANEAKGQGPGEDVASIDNANDDKKAKDVKDMRPFKFALAEFVKELLKPTWKEGKLSKEVHKTIVKKVVDKVTDSIQEAHIPRTKEKIDQYLSFSEPKLGKLVQAYLEKYKKP